MLVHKWVPLTVAAKLIGMSYSKTLAAAQAGRFGPIVHHAAGGPQLVSTRGIELACGFVLTETALDLAESGEGLTIMPEANLYKASPCKRETDPLVISAEVVRTLHDVGQMEGLELVD